jgi:hypothetical protein
MPRRFLALEVGWLLGGVFGLHGQSGPGEPTLPNIIAFFLLSFGQHSTWLPP